MVFKNSMIKYKIYDTVYDEFLVDNFSKGVSSPYEDIVIDNPTFSLVLQYYCGDAIPNTSNILRLIGNMLHYGDTLCAVPYDDNLDRVIFSRAIRIIDYIEDQT